MIQIAYFSLVLAVFCALYVLVAATIGLKTQRRCWVMSATKALHAIAGLLTLAVLLLLSFLIQRDFRLAYVASFTNLALSPGYAISALWAGQEGSLLTWTWLMSLCSAFFARKYTRILPDTAKSRTRRTWSSSSYPYLLLVFALTLGGFLFLLTLTANPFRLLASVPSDGRGLNPLLQNIYMVVHPPILFMGYAGFLVPFALTFAALCTGRLDTVWIREVRRWTLISWYCLGMGILLGARWAYLELGWGGYWSWDPVENSSFLPWITSTALLHTLALQRRRGLLLRWNLLACILNFSLCIFGTWITRSGILVSVHAYAQSPAGLYFLVFLLITGVCAFVLVLSRWKALRSQRSQSALLSKETSFFLANQLFIGFGFAVLYGTVYPVFSEILFGKKAVLGPPFFTMIAMVLGGTLLGLIGICQRIPWAHLSWQAFLKRFWFPSVVAGTGALLLRIWGIQHKFVLITGGLAVFVCVTAGTDIATHRKTGDPDRDDGIQGQLGRIVPFRRRLSMYQHLLTSIVFHVGMVLICLGIVVSSAYKREQEVTLAPGGSVHFGKYRLQYERLEQRIAPQKTALFAEVALYANEKKVGVARPEIRVYNPLLGETQETREVGLHSTLTEDVYLILAELQEDRTATFICIVNPMINLMWIGGFLVFTAGMLLEIGR